MTKQSLSFARVARDHVESWQRLAWFAIESAEREHLITLKAWWATLGLLSHVVVPRGQADRPAQPGRDRSSAQRT